MNFQPLLIHEAFLINLEKHTDDRGFFARTFCPTEFNKHGLHTHYVQDSISFNAKKGTLRGMHYQSPASEIKVVQCIKGEIYDVIIDLRKDSPSFQKWTTVNLTEDTLSILYIPKGCAHGFQTLKDNTLISYKISEFYQPAQARGIRWDDPFFNISWPLEVSCIAPRDLSYERYDP
jgi:dTDP-4-dehydrorhamnose 3,5-epimerase